MKKSLLSVALFLSVTTFAQKNDDVVPNNWHQLDKATTGYYGISLDKAYAFAKTKKLKSKQVIVAVIDGGIVKCWGNDEYGQLKVPEGLGVMSRSQE